MNYSIRGKLFKLRTKNLNIDRTRSPLLQVIEPFGPFDEDDIRRKKLDSVSELGIDRYPEAKPISPQTELTDFNHGRRIVGSLASDWKEYSFQLVLGSCELCYFTHESGANQEHSNQAPIVLMGIIQPDTVIKSGSFVETSGAHAGECLRLHTIELAIQVPNPFVLCLQSYCMKESSWHHERN
jgi:hypothetical protein